MDKLIEYFHSRDYRPYWFTETKENICIKIKFNSQRFSLGHQHGRHFFVLGHQHGRRDVMWKHSIRLVLTANINLAWQIWNSRSVDGLIASILRLKLCSMSSLFCQVQDAIKRRLRKTRTTNAQVKQRDESPFIQGMPFLVSSVSLYVFYSSSEVIKR